MNMTLEYWQKHAQTACFEMNLQVKQISEGVFYALTQQTQIHLIQNIINNGSDTLVFVLFSYLGKYPQPFAKDIHKVTYMISCVNAWQFKNFTFCRNNHPPFQNYVTRTIMTTLGIFLKISYENTATTQQILDFLIKLESKYIKLYLLKSFVDAVEVVDYEMGYMRYRMMVYSFQDNAIPMICQILMPYFYSIEEGVQINQLSFLQEKLNVNDYAMTNSEQQISLTSQQELQTDFVFMLLQKIVEFNYNITYSEYQNDTPIQTCLISFPDKVSQKILNRQFLNALFFIIDKVSDAKIGGKKHEYLEISLNCVAKMMQSRLNYLKQQVKQQFIYHSIKGLTLLLMKCHQIGSQTLLKGIIVCNKRLYMNCQLNYLKKISIKLSQYNNPQLYNVYIKKLLETIVIVSNKSIVHVENHLLSEALELSNRIVLSYSFKDEENMNQEYVFFMAFVKSIIDSFINNLCQPHSIFQSFNIISVSECKTWVNELFEKFKKLASTNFFYFYQQLSDKINLIKRLTIQSSISFANILFLLSQVIDHNYLQRNILLHSAKDRQYAKLSTIVNKAINIIRQYVSNRINYKCPQSSYIDSSVIIFIEAISIDFIIGFQSSRNFKIKQKLFDFMMYGKALCLLNQIQDNKSQQTILTFIYILTSYIQTQNQKDDDLMLTRYSLDVLQKIITKIKWRLISQNFKKNKIIQYLQDFFEKMFYSGMIHCDIRTRSSKLIALLSLQSLQQYKYRINKYIAIMKMQPIKIIQYDLIGIFQGIQSNVIIKYFYTKLNKEIKIEVIVQALFQKAKHENNQRQYQDFCKLLSCLLYNRYFRSQYSIIVYQNYNLMLPYLIDILKKINPEEEIDMDLWQSSLNILLQLFRGFVNGFMNVFLLETYSIKKKSVNLVQQYVFQIMKTIINVITNIKQYPQLEPIVLNVIHQINKGLLDYVFKDTSRRLSYVHAYLHSKTIDICIENMRMLLNGNKIQQEKLVLALDCLQFFYTYLNIKRKVTHQAVTYSNLQYHYDLMQKFIGQTSSLTKNEQFICSLLNFITSNHKNNITYLRKIGRLLFLLNQAFYQYIINSIAKLQVANQKLVEIEAILSQREQEFFIQKLKNWVREIDVFV